MFGLRREGQAVRTAKMSAVFMAGALVGGAVALLLAPQTGRKLQKNLRKGMRRMRSSVGHRLGEVGEGIREAGDAVRHAAGMEKIA